MSDARGGNGPPSVAIPSGRDDGTDGVLRDEDSSTTQSTRAMKFIPRCLRFRGPPEATGLALDLFARSTMLMSSVFLSPALLTLAFHAAGCNYEEDIASATETCKNRIYGMKPSSLVTNIATMSGLLVAATMPFVGACIDHTAFRKQAGYMSIAFLVVIKGVEIMISSKTWPFIALLQIAGSLLYNVHIMATYAYTCELSNDHTVQTMYNTAFTISAFLGDIFFSVIVMGVTLSLELDDVGTARVSQIVTTATSVIVFSFVWTFLFRDRPALTQVPPGMSLVTAGFFRIVQTARMIRTELPAVRYLMLSMMFSEPAVGALVFIFTTFMSQFLGVNARGIGLVILIVLVTALPGSKLGEFLALKFNPLTAAKIMLLVFIVTTSVAATLLTGPERSDLMPIFAAFWGIGLGGLHPLHTTIFVTIIPRGQESELMGNYIFAGTVLGWLPPLVFTTLNEAGLKMTIGLASLVGYFVMALFYLMCIGNYYEARKAAQGTPSGNGGGGANGHGGKKVTNLAA